MAATFSPSGEGHTEPGLQAGWHFSPLAIAERDQKVAPKGEPFDSSLGPIVSNSADRFLEAGAIKSYHCGKDEERIMGQFCVDGRNQG
jgi:hypothetical protein